MKRLHLKLFFVGAFIAYAMPSSSNEQRRYVPIDERDDVQVGQEVAERYADNNVIAPGGPGDVWVVPVAAPANGMVDNGSILERIGSYVTGPIDCIGALAKTSGVADYVANLDVVANDVWYNRTIGGYIKDAARYTIVPAVAAFIAYKYRGDMVRALGLCALCKVWQYTATYA